MTANGDRGWRVAANGDRVSFRGYESVLELDRGSECAKYY